VCAATIDLDQLCFGSILCASAGGKDGELTCIRCGNADTTNERPPGVIAVEPQVPPASLRLREELIPDFVRMRWPGLVWAIEHRQCILPESLAPMDDLCSRSCAGFAIDHAADV